MSEENINLAAPIHAATKQGKAVAAREVFMDGDQENLQQIGDKTHQLEDAFKDITISGGASTANAVSYSNDTSGMTAVTAQGAIDELAAKNNTQDATIATKANAEDISAQMKTEQSRVNTELAKKFNSENITQETGEAEDKIMSQKAVSNRFINFLVFKNPKNITDVTDGFIDNTVIQNEEITTNAGFTVFHKLKVDNTNGEKTIYLYANFEVYGTATFGDFKNILIVDSQNNIRKADILLGKNCVAIQVGFIGYFAFKKANTDIHFVESFYEDSKQELINTIMYANSIVQTIEFYPIYDQKIEILNDGKMLASNGE